MYTPEVKPFGDVHYLQSEDKQDWYETVPLFQPDTYKVMFESNGVILAVTRDASTIAPYGFSVAEVEALPENFSWPGEWSYLDGVIVRTEDQKASVARVLRDTFLKTTDGMMVLDYTVNDVLLTDEQRAVAVATRVSFKQWPTQKGWPNIPLPSVPDWMMTEAIAKGFTNSVWPEPETVQ